MKRCTIACDTPNGVRTCELTLQDDATVEAALAAAEALLGKIIDWGGATTGIYGQVCAREYLWEDGDRVEIYRPLQVDPRSQRRQRAGPGRR